MTRLKVCPQCGKQYDADRHFCEVDGARLISRPQHAGQPPDTGNGTDPGPQTGLRQRLQHIPKETVVGIIVVAVLCAIVGGVFAYRKSNAFQIKITFEEGHGLQVGDTVFIRGANAGQVVSAAFKNGQFVVTIDVQTQMASQVRRGSEFFILTEKIAMNKKCISIVVTDPNSPPIKSGEVVKGDDSLFRYYLGHELPKAAGQAIKEVDTLLKKGVDAIKDRVGGGDE